MQAYENALRGSNSSMVMTPDSQFFDYLRSDRPSRDQGAASPAVQN